MLKNLVYKVWLVFVLLLIGLKNWWKIFKPITNHSNCNCTITFKGHLKTALNYLNTCFTTGFIWIIHTIIFSIALPQDINAFSTFTFKLVIRTGVVTICRKKIWQSCLWKSEFQFCLIIWKLGIFEHMKWWTQTKCDKRMLHTSGLIILLTKAPSF